MKEFSISLRKLQGFFRWLRSQKCCWWVRLQWFWPLTSVFVRSSVQLSLYCIPALAVCYYLSELVFEKGVNMSVAVMSLIRCLLFQRAYSHLKFKVTCCFIARWPQDVVSLHTETYESGVSQINSTSRRLINVLLKEMCYCGRQAEWTSILFLSISSLICFTTQCKSAAVPFFH